MVETDAATSQNLPKQTVTDRPAPPRAKTASWKLWATLAAVLSGVVVWMIGAVDLPAPGQPVPASLGAPQQVDTATGLPDITRQVAALGRLEPLTGVVLVAPPPTSIDAPIREMLVHKGQVVAAGDAIAVLSTAPRAAAAVTRAQAEYAAHEGDLARTLRALQRDQIEAFAARSVAAFQLDETGRILARAERLSAGATTSQAALDQARTNHDIARAEIDRARATAALLADPLTQHPDYRAAQQALARARADLALAEVDLENSRIYAPSAGTVLDIVVQPGERPGEDGVVRLGNTREMVVRMEVHQNRIHRVALGDHVTILGAALDAPLSGSISAIGLEVLDQGIIGTDPVASNNARVFEVFAQLDAASSGVAARLVNLQVLATIEVAQ